MPGTGWLWKLYIFGGLALWIGAVVAVSSRSEPKDQAGPVRLTATIGGAVFFGGLFLISFLQIRRASTRRASDLYERLAVAPIPKGAKTPARTMSTIAYVYLAFGVLVTGGALGAGALGDDGIARWILWGVLALVVVWVLYLFFGVWRQVFRATDDAMAPLGLRVTGQPSYLPNIVGGGGHLEGAVVYEGVRHGRRVRVEHWTGDAITAIELPPPDGAPPGWSAPVVVPRSVEEMTVLTGEPVTSWRKVAVEAANGAVTVHRSGNGAGGWMLADLLLAESVATRGAAP